MEDQFKERMATRGGGVKQNAGNGTLLDFNFVTKKITEETEDLYQSDEQGVVLIKNLFLHRLCIVYEIERPTMPSIP